MAIAPREFVRTHLPVTRAERRRQTQRAGLVLLFVLDTCIITAMTLLAVALRNSLGDTRIDYTDAYELQSGFMNPYALVALGWVLVLALGGSYTRSNIGAGTNEYSKVAQASVFTAAIVGITCYLVRFPLSRGFFILLFGLGIPVLALGRFALRRLIQLAHRRGHMLNRVLIAGNPDHVDEVAKVLTRELWLGYDVAGALLPHGQDTFETPSGIPVVGDVRGAVRAVHLHDADMVIFADGSFRNSREFRRMAWQLEDVHAHMVVVPSLTDVSAERIETRPVGGLPFVSVERPRAQKAGRWGKRLFDLVGSGALLLVAGPVIGIIALMIWLQDRGKPIFQQVRVGRHGQFFHCLKLRSMVVNAEEIKQQLMAQNEFDDVLFKMKGDPRITPIGAFIRRYSLDELPQLWNVFRGDMSLIGPRPHLPNEVNRYESDAVRRLSVRPGMTGLWQVSGRSDLPWDEAVRLDLYYVDNWCMVQDLAILARTVKAVVGPSGAY